MSDSSTLALAKDLISRESVTPEDAGCQEVMINRLKKLGFEIEVMVFEDTTNFWLDEEHLRHYLLLQVTPMLCLPAMYHNGIHHRLSLLSSTSTYMVAVPLT